jgi:hypothetical protein
VSRLNTTDFARAVEILSKPICMSIEQANANRLLAKAHPAECSHCDDDGCFAGKTKRRKCKRCGGMKRGYSYAGAIFWVGWPEKNEQKRDPGE